MTDTPPTDVTEIGLKRPLLGHRGDITTLAIKRPTLGMLARHGAPFATIETIGEDGVSIRTDFNFQALLAILAECAEGVDAIILEDLDVSTASTVCDLFYRQMKGVI
jgi:hypothetical protein